LANLAVDRGAAAQHPRLLVFAQRRAFVLPGIVVADDLGRDLEFGPVEARIEIGRAGIAVADFGRLVAGRRVLARLAEQDLVGALAESRWAMTEPAEPPPTIMCRTLQAFPFAQSNEAKASSSMFSSASASSFKVITLLLTRC
jgi:hypothetical protein